MSATEMQDGNQTEVTDKQWVALFPKHLTENYLTSLSFIKPLTAVAVSTITYLRGAFPEESFTIETLAGLRVKLLKAKCEDEMAQFVSTAMQQAFEAIDKKYVQQLALCFYNGACVAENLVQYHVFEYSYNPGGVTFSINSKNRNSNKKAMRCSLDKLKRNAAMLIRSISIHVIQNCGEELPINYNVKMRLHNTEDCPEDYQAPGFVEATGPDNLDATRSQEVRMGWVDKEACVARWVEPTYHNLIARSFIGDGLVDNDAPVTVYVFRRTLVVCLQTAAMSFFQLQAQARLSPTSTSNILRLLTVHHNTDYADLEIPRKINHLQLKVTMKKFFQMDDEEDTADRLMMKEGKESTDPVGEMLSPIEKISLNNTFNPGTVVDSPTSNIPGLNADLVQL